MKKITTALTSVAILALPIIVAAQAGAGNVTGVQNPLNSAYSNIPLFIEGFLKVMVQIGLPIVALFLLIAGYKFVSAGGNESKIKEAKENFMYVIFGSALILGAWVLATLIGNTVTQIVQ